VLVSDPSQVGEARRAASALAGRLGFGETEAGKVALVVTEAGTNLVKHGGGGELVLRALERDGAVGVEVLALDRGPGMTAPDRCLRDGFSTAGSPGTGLGAVARLSDRFDLYSAPEAGTALLARLWSRPATPSPTPQGLEVGVVHLARPGEEVCGDGWAAEWRDGRGTLLVADGLGHGPVAAEAAREAVRVFRENADLDAVEILRRVHAALAHTRGAAVAVADLVPAAEVLRFAGVGNISGTIFAGGASRSTISHNGTAGYEMRKVQEFVYPFPAGALLVLHSDGLATHWRLDRYPGLAARHPGLVAGVLYRDFQRGRDDVTVLVARCQLGG
jgi:anti-sigma regulatory factor (Ser/Thr protein kinase)